MTVPESRDSHPSSSHEPMRSVDLGDHSVKTQFPKDRYCEICQRTKITRAPCRRGIGRAENFGDFSRSQSSQWRLWIPRQSSICSRGERLGYSLDPLVSVQNKNFSANRKELAKVLGSLKSFTLTICWNLAMLVKIFLGIIARQHHTHHKQMGLLREQCAEWKKVRLRHCLQSGVDEDSMECYTYLQNIQDLLSWWEDSIRKAFWANI